MNLTQVALSDELKVSRGYLADIESGRSTPSRNFVEVLTGSRNVNPEWLLLEIGEQFLVERSGWEVAVESAFDRFRQLLDEEESAKPITTRESAVPDYSKASDAVWLRERYVLVEQICAEVGLQPTAFMMEALRTLSVFERISHHGLTLLARAVKDQQESATRELTRQLDDAYARLAGDK